MTISLSLQTTVFAVLQVFLLGICGFTLVKRNVLNESGVTVLAQLLIRFLLPVFMFHEFTQHFRFDEHPNWWVYPLISFLIMGIGIVVSRLIFLGWPQFKHKNEFLSLIVFQNCGYLPLILITGLFPEVTAARLNVSILLFLIGFNFGIWTLGVFWLTAGKRKTMKFEEFLNPPFVAMVCSMCLVALKWNRFIPSFVALPVKMLSQCTLPLAMIVVGGSLAKMKSREVDLSDLTIYLLVKLILLPLIALTAITVFRLDFIIGFLVLIECAVPSAVTLSVIARHYKTDERFINQALFYSHLLSMLTIPFFLYIWMKWIQ